MVARSDERRKKKDPVIPDYRFLRLPPFVLRGHSVFNERIKRKKSSLDYFFFL